ncbi:hypothetical protein TrLO_g15324 [Triparma laevis f. longispina]|uniref:Uncharacterized protein n=1 Tax=Triparma laevis f. longispina TaxID=1714387 RepID=A0A9W7KZM2_9STRA|nr:hypothetical protein TrLO_g15324 [Triparma laevis f. longispina]
MLSSTSSFSSSDKSEVLSIIKQSSSGHAIFSDRYMGDPSGTFIFNTLKKSETNGPVRVDAKGCYMGLQSGLAIAEYLKHPMSKIEILSLEWNSLGSFENGLTEIATSLALNNTLKTLDLRNNNIGPNGGSMLARGLRDNRCLNELDLRWNEIGNVGALAFKEIFTVGHNTMLRSLKLAGNKISDVVLTEVESVIGKKIEPGIEGGTISDEYHVVKGKNEELQKELAKMAAELQAAKDENRTKDTQHEIVNARSKNDMSSRIESLEKQLDDSAGTISLLEIEVLREKERADRLQDSVVKEQREKDTALSSLRVDREAAAGKKITADREKAQLTTSLKITEETLEVLRAENDDLRKNFATREKELLTSLSDRERKLSQARNHEDKAKAEQSRVEVELGDAKLKEQMAEERASQSAKLLDECIEDRAKQVEEARRSVQETMETQRNELMGRLKAAELRVSEAESKLGGAESKQRAAESAAAQATVTLEQQLSEQAYKLRKEYGDLQDGETRQLTDALDVVKSQRESQDNQLSQMTADLESLRDLRQRESESAKRTIEGLNKSLSDALKESRRERGSASDLKLEVASLKRQIEPFKRKVEVSDAEKKRTEEFRTRDVSNLQALLANEREERAKEAIGYQKRLDDCNEMLRTAKESISEQRTNHMKEFHKLEKGMVAAVQAIFADRKGTGGKKRGKKKGEGAGVEGEENVKSEANVA